MDDSRLVVEKLLDHGFDYFSRYSAIEINSTFEYFSTNNGHVPDLMILSLICWSVKMWKMEKALPRIF